MIKDFIGKAKNLCTLFSIPFVYDDYLKYDIFFMTGESLLILHRFKLYLSNYKYLDT